MQTPSANLSVWVGERAACVRVTGRANFTTSVDFRKLMEHFRATGQPAVVLDLTECMLMDSTFLGVLAAQARKLLVTCDGQPSPGVTLLNPNPRVRDLIENLGVPQFFHIQQAQAPQEKFEPVQPAAAPSKQELTQTCLTAHLDLMEMNPENVAKFKDVAQFFAEKLKSPDPEGH